MTRRRFKTKQAAERVDVTTSKTLPAEAGSGAPERDFKTLPAEAGSGAEPRHVT